MTEREGGGWVQCIACGRGFYVRSRHSQRWWCGSACKQSDIGIEPGATDGHSERDRPRTEPRHRGPVRPGPIPSPPMTTPESLCTTCDGRRWVNADRPGFNPCPDCGDRSITATGQTGSDPAHSGSQGPGE